MANNLRLIQRCAEFRPLKEVRSIPKGTRGIYALLKEHKTARGDKFDVVYIGMSRTGIKSRLADHVARKKGLWTHFSVYAVWPNVYDEEIRELEGLFRAIYRKDTKANSIAVQKGFAELKRIRNNSFEWK
jgi:hypothetical protein